QLLACCVTLYYSRLAVLVCADLDRHVVCWFVTAFRTREPVVLAVQSQWRPVTLVPDATHDPQGLVQGGHRLTGGEPCATHRLNGVPEGTGPQTHREPATGQ